jgi:hypothetical protein
MVSRFLLFVLAFLCSAKTFAQGNMAADIKVLKETVKIAERLDPWGETTGDSIDWANAEIARLLTKILTNPEIVSQNLDTLLPVKSAHSDDRKLWIYTWYANNGGTMLYNFNLVHYRDAIGAPKVAFTSCYDEEQNDDPGRNTFNSQSAAFYEVHRLQAVGKDIYLCLGAGTGCSTCIYNVATVVELAGDSASFIYLAFSDELNDVISPSCFMISARIPDIEEFVFDDKTQSLVYNYLPDTDLEEFAAERIKGRLVFNGVKFISNPY